MEGSKNNMKEINSQEVQNSNTEQGIKRNKEDKGKKINKEETRNLLIIRVRFTRQV